MTYKIIGNFCKATKPVITLLAVTTLSACQGMAVQPDAPVKGTEITTASIQRSDVMAKAIADEDKFQTKEQRLKVEPLNWDKTIGKPNPDALELKIEPTNEPPADTESGFPDPRAEDEAKKDFSVHWSVEHTNNDQYSFQKINFALGEEQLSNSGNGRFYRAGTQDIYTQFAESLNTMYPQKTIGKLFTNAGSCSASVVSGKNAIVTAAHCCYDRSQRDWIGGWSFAPAYDQGNTPYGQFGWSSATILTSWITAGNRASDVCVIKLNNNSSNRPVTYYTGWLGRSWNYPSIQEHFSLGFPGNLGGGQTLQLCTSESFSPSQNCGGSGVLNTGCTMTFGASGGPWIRNYKSNSWVNSVVSGYDSASCTGTFGETFNGPRFTSGNIKTICDAAGC